MESFVAQAAQGLQQLYRLYAGPDIKRLDDAAKVPQVDLERIAGIVSFSSIGCGTLLSDSTDSSRFGFAFRGCGVWPLASFMNHSCVPNTVVFFVGDLILVRAARLVRQGDELTTSYVPSSSSYKQRQAMLTRLFRFRCECELCVADLNRAAVQPDLEQQREAAFDAFQAMRDSRRTDTEKWLAKFVSNTRKRAEEFSRRFAYKDRYDPKLRTMYHALGQAYNDQEKYSKGAKAFEVAYRAVVGNETQENDVLFSYNSQTEDVMYLGTNVWHSCWHARESAKAEEYLGKLSRAAKLCWGNVDTELMGTLYPGLPFGRSTSTSVANESPLLNFIVGCVVYYFNMFEDSEKDKGNAAFRRQDFEGALMHYNRAITNAGSGATADLFANKAAAQLNLEQYDSCSRQCLKALAAPGLTPALEAKIRSRSKSACEAQMKLLEAFKEEFKKCEVGPKGIKQMADLLPMMSKGENPTERRANVISEYDQLVERCKNDRGESKVLFAALLHGESSRVCNALLSDLKPIAIDQLRLHETSVGKVLICRTIVEPIKLSALGVLVEDPNGDVMRVAVYNFCSSSDDLNAVLPAGTYLAIKEPCYTTESTFSLSAPTLSFSVVPVDEDEHPKRGSRSKQNHGTSTSELPVAANNGKPAIRVDNPADLVYLDQNHFLLNKVAWRTAAPVKLPASPRCADSWESLQRRGNELFVAGKYELAVVAYTDAIELKRKVAPQEEVADLLANRAAAYLGDDRPIDALWDCRSALFVQPGHLKATLRMARAHACLAAYGDAKAVLEKSPHTTRPEVKAEISRLDRLIREQQLGDYELKSLLNEAAASQAPRLDHADFNGGVAMQWISEEKGNGLVATRDFAPGELLFVSKAIEATYRSECDVQVSIKGYKFHADEEVVKRKTQNECASRIIRKVSKNKDLAKQLYRLYAGPEFERFDDTGDADGPAIDPKRIAAIVSFSAIACGEFQSNAKSDTGIGDFPDFDKVRFGFSFRGCGVWPVASFMNHSCAPNSIVFFVGDLLLVRAATPIRKGDELTTSYVCSASTYTQRQELLNERFGFNCECELCLCDLERAFDQPDLEDQREAFERSQVATKSIVERFSMFPSLYGYKDRYDQLAQRWCKALGIYYIGTQEWLKAAGAWEMAYAATVGDGTDTGDTFRYNAMQSDAVFLCFNIANSYLLGMDFAKTKEYVGKMQEAARIAWGGAVDEEFLVILYPHLELPILDLFSCLRKGTAFIKANNTSCEELLRMT